MAFGTRYCFFEGTVLCILVFIYLMPVEPTFPFVKSKNVSRYCQESHEDKIYDWEPLGNETLCLRTGLERTVTVTLLVLSCSYIPAARQWLWTAAFHFVLGSGLSWSLGQPFGIARASLGLFLWPQGPRVQALLSWDSVCLTLPSTLKTIFVGIGDIYAHCIYKLLISVPSKACLLWNYQFKNYDKYIVISQNFKCQWFIQLHTWNKHFYNIMDTG